MLVDVAQAQVLEFRTGIDPGMCDAVLPCLSAFDPKSIHNAGRSI